MSVVHDWWEATMPKPKGRRMTDHDRTEIARRYRHGESASRIAQMIGFSRTAVNEALERMRTPDGLLAGFDGMCPIPIMRQVSRGVPANVYCTQCDRGDCHNMTEEQIAEVLADYESWRVRKVETIERHNAERERYRQYRTYENQAWATTGRKG